MFKNPISRNLLRLLSGITIIGAIFALFLLAENANANSIRVDDPDALKQTQSLGSVIQSETGRPVHILYVHGMAAEEAGGSSALIRGICRYAEVQCTKETRKRVERRIITLGPRPDATYLKKRIWENDVEWASSQPFVDRYILPRVGKPPVVLDEINWWPLLAALKCRILVSPETALSGIDHKKLDLCHKNEPNNRHYPWIDGDAFEQAMRGPTISKGGMLFNSWLKHSLMNWGMSDAVVALGPMRYYFRQAINGGMKYAAEYDGRGTSGQNFVIVSASLGSFIVLDAATKTDTPAAREVVGETSNLYFFANQFALLELGRIAQLPRSSELSVNKLAPPLTEPDLSPLQMLETWSRGQTSSEKKLTTKLRQIIAFNDPSDALTFNVPKIPAADGNQTLVVNIYVRNGFDWFGLFKNPFKAHTGHSENQVVLKQMLQVDGAK